MSAAADKPFLSPCPFCGGQAKIYGVRDGRKAHCAACHASAPPAFHGRDGWEGTELRAIAAWNRRPTITVDARTPAENHNDLAPALLIQLVKGTRTEAERLVVLESVILGVLLYHNRKGRSAGELLDALTARVSERLSRPKP